MLYTVYMRLDRFLSETTGMSRKDAKEQIKRKCVAVNGNTVNNPGLTLDEEKDLVTYNGESLKYEKFVYYMLNKPAGYVSATKDNVDPTVISLLKAENRDDLFPIGRLDKDTVGLLFITNDGELSHHLTSPKHHVEKTYFVKSALPLSDDDIQKLETGVDIGEDSPTKPAHVKIISDCESELTICEGMFHQVKRMYKAVNNEVLYLKRMSEGGVVLDSCLGEGKYRRLFPEEIERLKG